MVLLSLLKLRLIVGLPILLMLEKQQPFTSGALIDLFTWLHYHSIQAAHTLMYLACLHGHIIPFYRQENGGTEINGLGQDDKI